MDEPDVLDVRRLTRHVLMSRAGQNGLEKIVQAVVDYAVPDCRRDARQKSERCAAAPCYGGPGRSSRDDTL